MATEPSELSESEEVKLPYTLAHRIRVVAVSLTAFWIMAQIVMHLVMSVAFVMGGSRAKVIDIRLGFPVTIIQKAPAKATSSTTSRDAGTVSSGAVSSGTVTPGSEPDVGGPSSGGGASLHCEGDPGPWACDWCTNWGPLSWLCQLAWIVGVCIIIVFLILGTILDWVCNSKWVWDVDIVRSCRKKKCKKWCLCCNKWFCWIEILIQKIMQWICKWKEILKWLLFAACVIAGIIIFM